MLVTFDGGMGQGKTAAATALGVAEYHRSGVALFTTYHLNDVIICPVCHQKHRVHYADPSSNGNGIAVYQCVPGGEIRRVTETDEIDHIPYTYLSLEDFYTTFRAADQGKRTLHNCIFLLDEAYLFMDARHSGSKINRLFNSFVFQTRKRGVDMYITTHSVDRLDKRIRQATDLRISCRYSLNTQIITIRIRDMLTGERRRIYISGPEAAFPYYDTNELVTPTGKLYRMTKEELT